MYNKFGAVKTSRAGRSFASKLEAALFDELATMESAGVIKDLQQQAQVYLTDAKILYKPDFKAYNTVTNRDEYFEAKGFETPEWRIKRRLWAHYGPSILYVYVKQGTGITLKEEILPKGIK